MNTRLQHEIDHDRYLAIQEPERYGTGKIPLAG
jgi:hypothetical protein